MKKQKGRPGKYEKRVKPYLARIKEMARQMSEEQIAKRSALLTVHSAMTKTNTKNLKKLFRADARSL